ncbi:MAG: GNAT family N-acetyltransferase [Gammaproteobacteria bacterium]|nr:GNAT family N-acetyltransferase [Gammaproteobacteria bacterium]
MTISYRMGEPDDAYSIAELLHVASCGLSDFLLNNILPNCDIIDLIALGVTDKTASISFSKTVVAEIDKKIVGIANFYPSVEHKIADIMRTFIPEERINHIADLFCDLLPNSMYIHALAVKPEVMKHNIGYRLLCKVQAFSKLEGFDTINAHVSRQNKVFTSLTHAGFSVHKKIYLAPHLLLPTEMMLLFQSLK